MFENYNEHISECNYEEFAENICDIVARYGVEENIECVGSVKINDTPQGGINHPININGSFSIGGTCDFETEVVEQH